MKKAALLYGLNYADVAGSTLRGCVNDVINLSRFFSESGWTDVNVFTDNTSAGKTECTHDGIMRNLNNLALRSWADELDVVWFSFSGHGSKQRDSDGDERDGFDEGLVPCDFRTRGLILDDEIRPILSRFNPRTHVIILTDCCHSGTICDLTFRYPNRRTRVVESAPMRAKILKVSGCADSQTSADAWNVQGLNQMTGAMTSCFLLAVRENTERLQDVFVLVSAINSLLKVKGYSQIPQLTATYDVQSEPSLTVLL